MADCSTISIVEWSEIVRNAAIVVGGFVGLWIAWWRGRAHNRQAITQSEQTLIAQRAHTTEVFKDAVEQLGHDKFEVRLGAVFTLKRIAKDYPDEFDSPVIELLTAYVRERGKDYDTDERPGADIIEIVKFLNETEVERNG